MRKAFCQTSKYIVLFVLICLFVSTSVFGQNNKSFSYENEYISSEPDHTDTLLLQLLNRMCDSIGAAQNRYLIRRCEAIDKYAICNSQIIGDKAYILYNQAYLFSLNANKKKQAYSFTHGSLTDLHALPNYWEIFAVLAHELGHYVNQDLNSQTTLDVEKELEADEFSGHMMCKFGATLKQAQSVMHDSSVRPERTVDHPSRNERLIAIQKGFDKARGVPSVCVICNGLGKYDSTCIYCLGSGLRAHTQEDCLHCHGRGKVKVQCWACNKVIGKQIETITREEVNKENHRPGTVHFVDSFTNNSSKWLLPLKTVQNQNLNASIVLQNNKLIFLKMPNSDINNSVCKSFAINLDSNFLCSVFVKDIYPTDTSTFGIIFCSDAEKRNYNCFTISSNLQYHITSFINKKIGKKIDKTIPSDIISSTSESFKLKISRKNEKLVFSINNEIVEELSVLPLFGNYFGCVTGRATKIEFDNFMIKGAEILRVE